VALSTCEAKYHSAVDATREIIHLRHLIGRILNAPITETTTIWEDNQSTIVYSQNAMVSNKATHIDLKVHFVKDYVEKGTVRLVYLPFDHTVADTLTKPLPGPALSMHTYEMMGMIGPMSRHNLSYIQGECCNL
jgi:hypothetical protein